MPGHDDDPFGMNLAATGGTPARPGTVRRDGVLRRLASVSHAASLVVLVAPAGYGKTTVLSQWAARDPRRFAWVSVEDADNDPVHLLRHIVTALHRVEPVNDRVLTALAARDASPRNVGVPHVLGWLAGHSSDHVLVLDDLHRLHSTGSTEVIRALASQLPPRWHLAITSRAALGVDLGVLRRQRRYLELGTDDLAFSEDETRAVLAEAGVEQSDERVQALVRRTEGWPAGLYLMALTLRDGPDRASVARSISDDFGEDARLADYFRSEVLDRQSSETVGFLLRTAVLERMSGALCDAVLATTGSAVRLEELENRNLFLVSQDGRGEWYRYHRLFAEMLLSELRRREPGMDLELHRRASVWFSEHGLPEEAITHALAGHDLATAARLMTMWAQRFVSAGRIATIRRWIETMGDEGPKAYPPLAVIAAWVWALEGEPAKAHQSLVAAEAASFTGTPSDGSTSLESGIRILRGAMAPHGVDQMLVDGGRAVELEPPGSPWHPLATWVLGSAELLHGDQAAAAKAFERAAHVGRERQQPAVSLSLAQLSLSAAERSDWAAAGAHAADAQEVIRAARLQSFWPSMMTYAASAKVAAHVGDRRAALLHIGNALRLYSSGPTPVAFPWLAAQGAIVLGRIFLELDDLPAARLKASEAREHLARLRTQGTLTQELQRLASDVARRNGSESGVSALTLTQAELRVLHLLPTHLSLAEISGELDVSRNTVKSHVAAVYRKLQAGSRADAVRQGRQLGLLNV